MVGLLIDADGRSKYHTIPGNGEADEMAGKGIVKIELKICN